MTGSAFGIPLSTTHCMVGAILGVAGSGEQIKWREIGKMSISWLLTVPLGMGATYWLVGFILQHS